MPDYTYRLPSLGADMESAVLVEWLIKPGDKVKKGQEVLRLQTEKAFLDGEIWVDGVVKSLLVEAGQNVSVGTPIAIIEVERLDESMRASSFEPAPASPGQASQPASQPAEASGKSPRAKASPAARKQAESLRVDLHLLRGSGPDGVITVSDVLAAKGAGIAEFPSDGGRAAGGRQAIARLMSTSKRDIPHYYLQTELRLDRTLAFLQEKNADRSVDERVLPIALICKAVACAVARVPEMNGYWKDNCLEIVTGVNLGFAISLKGGGLVAPSIANADQLSVQNIMATIRDLVSRARGAALKISDMSPPTLTLTSLGDQGVHGIFGVIYPPQVALVGLGSIRRQPVVGDQDEIKVESVATASLSGDHRASDGHRGALFLVEIARLLGQPQKLWEAGGAADKNQE